MPVAAHTGLVRDDRGILGVGLSFTAVSGSSVIDHSATDVERRLIGRDQQSQQQRRPGTVQIFRPRRLTALRECSDIVDECLNHALVVADSSRQQALTFAVDDHAVMSSLTGIDSDPYVRHSGRLPSLKATRSRR
jgi:hypothetical protein